MATDQQPAIGEERAGYAPPVLDLIAAACVVALSVWVMIEAARMEVPDALATAPGLLPSLPRPASPSWRSGSAGWRCAAALPAPRPQPRFATP